tara:strand:- start:49 stop:216 length:168 start_codon:yes stop_codon:yes gene_type:complete
VNLRDLLRLERRIEKIRLKECPPSLKMITLGLDDPEPDNIDQWTMMLRIDPKLVD